MTALKITSLRSAPLFIFALALALFLIIFFRYQRKPEITEIDKAVAGPGDRLEILGHHFGDAADGSRLYVGANALTSTGIIEWTNQRIVARIPRSDGAVLVKVKTRSGLSNGVVLGDSSRFPRVDYGPWLPGGPYIEYSEPSFGEAGTLVTLKGEGFGDKRGSGRIWVNREDKSDLLGTEEPDTGLYVEAEAVQLWSDKEVRFWIPDSAVSGNVYLQKAGRFSNPVPFDIRNESGAFILSNPVQWSLRQELFVDKIAAFPGHSLYIHVPSAQEGVGQKQAVIIDAVQEPDRQPVRVQGNLSLFRYDELYPGRRIKFSRQLIVPGFKVETRVNPERLRPYDRNNTDLAGLLTDDQWIKPQSVSRTAGRIVGRLNNDWAKTRAVYNYVVDLLSFANHNSTETRPAPSEYIGSPVADSEGYSFLFCSLARAAGVPARPVGGLIVDADDRSVPWWWAEVWIEGIGWVPVDPALAETEAVPVLPGVDGDVRDFYLGGLEGRHIAFSRGILDSGPLQSGPVLHIPDDRYTLQGSWEEVSGNIESYDSRWPIPRVTAVYQLGN